jgi:Lanthionine synthetase C-like protein
LTLFSPESHVALTGTGWDADRVRLAIAQVVAGVEAAFDEGWPVHPADDHESLRTKRLRSVYTGGAGVVDALHRLARRNFVELRRDYVSYLEESAVAPMDWSDSDDTRSLSFGETGIRLVLQRLAPSSANRGRLAELIAANAQDEHRELMSGSAGTILAGREVGLDVTASVEWLRAQRDDDGLWTQRGLGEKPVRFLGPAHGFAGCVLALGDVGGVSDALRPHAVEEDGLVNWPAVAGSGLLDHRDKRIRVQWCHGAPGIVATLGRLLDEDLALGGGELTWRAGPLEKGAGLCHGTAGNGYAFLVLFEQTGDELWLARARAFAMHALEQLQRDRYSLWTGCLGTALYLADCVEGGGTLPIP